VTLTTRTWQVRPLDVIRAHSSWFGDQQRFPPGTVEFDCALVMRDIAHQWHAEPPLSLVS
jgi:hypothetical protein